jgi:DNA-binding MarR family transcriptional regulator/predicted GNAT family acetyltransferase
MSDRVGEVREFNRFYTRVLGLLDEGLAHTPYSLTEARLLFELAQVESADVADLRTRLGLDAGYLSRILTRFEADDLVVRERSAADARRQVIRLTPRGHEAFRDLDARSADDVQALIGRVSEPGRDRLITSMRTIRGLLRDPKREPEVTIRGLGPGDLGWVVQRHGVRYAEEYDWNDEFEALVARIVAEYVEDFDAERDRAWIAEVDGEPVGSVFCVHKDARVAQLRLLLVEPSARGLGIGTRLVDACLDFAREAGYQELVLWTNSVLAAARRIYQRAGFELVDESPNPAFGQQLTAQTWRREL